jgi:hypothetical protein
MESTKVLLTEVKNKLIRNMNHDGFDKNQNVIGLLGKGYDELSMCKILWFILNYKTDNCKPFLSSFIANVLELSDITGTELNTAFAYREYYIPKTGRRIDLVIKTARRFIPIEAKIYSDEHDNQCCDYLSYARSLDPNASLFFLSIDGKLPDTAALSDDGEVARHTRGISWQQILEWLKEESENDSPIQGVIEQYCKALAVLVNKEQKDFYMEIDKLINSPEEIKAAIVIEKVIEQKKERLLSDYIDGIRNSLKGDDRFDLDPRLNEQLNNTERISSYYSFKKSTYPGLNYNLGSIGIDNYNKEFFLVLRFEIDYRAFAGFCVWYIESDGTLKQLQRPDETIIETIKTRLYCPEQISSGKDWWLYWQYAASNNQSEQEAGPNFKNPNDEYYELFDRDHLNTFIQESVDLLKKLRDSIK